MTTVQSSEPTSTGDLESYGSLKAELAEASRRWESAARTSSALTVFAVVMAGMALIASIMAWGFAHPGRSTAVASGPAAGGQAVVAEAPFASPNVSVSLAEYNVTLPSTTVTAGVKSLKIADAGAMEHELLVFHPAAGIDPNNLPVDDVGNVVEDAPGVNKVSDGDNIAPGQTQDRTLDLTVPGTYVFVCNLPGHYRLGMRTVVTVVAPAQAVSTTSAP